MELLKTKSMDAIIELKALSKVIHDSIQAIETIISSNNTNFPSPYTSFTMESEAPRMLPGVDQACALIISAAGQLISSVRSPMHSVTDTALQVRPLTSVL